MQRPRLDLARLAAPLLIAAFGCSDRTRATADGTDPPPDALPDAARDTGPGATPDAIGDAISDAIPDAIVDAMPPSPDALIDAMTPAPDATPDAMPDAMPDAAMPPPLDGPIFPGPGRATCPAVIALGDHWRVAWVGADLSDPPTHRLYVAEVTPADGAVRVSAEPLDTAPGLPGPDRLPDVVRLPDPETVALVVPDHQLHLRWRPIDAPDAPWTPVPGVHEPIDRMARTVDLARNGPLLGRLVPRDDALEAIVDLAPGAPPRTTEVFAFPPEPVGFPRTGRIAALGGGFVVGFGTADAITLRALGEAPDRLAATLPAAGPGFGLAAADPQVAVAWTAPDPALAGRPFAEGYGRPVFARIGGDAEPRIVELSPDPVRGHDAAIAPFGDGWLVAWSRLRVDGDRNRTEIEVVRTDADGLPLHPPARLTRAHGFSFCPAVGAAIDDRALVAWLDTRDGAERIHAAVGDPRDWPSAHDDPEPTPPPPVAPEECFAAREALPEPADALVARPDGAGFRVVWIGFDGRAGTARVLPEGIEDVRRFDAGRRPTRLALAGDHARWWFAARVDEAVRLWRITHGGVDEVPLQPAFGPVDGAPVALAASADRVLIVEEDTHFEHPTRLRRFDADGVERGEPVPLDTPGGGHVGTVVATSDGARFGVAWRTSVEVAPGIRHAALARLVIGPDVIVAADAPAIEVDALDGSTRPGDVQAHLGPDGLALTFSADAGRSFARAVWHSAADGALTRLDVDAAQSLRPAVAGPATAWIEQRPVERFAVHYAPTPGAPVEVLPVLGPERILHHLTQMDGDPVLLWRAGVQTFVRRFPPDCRVPAAVDP